MTDQNQPKLTLEEELDVLEAVYKIGKEKGLELLRPEQVKKLRDAGRLNNQAEKNVPHRDLGKGFEQHKINYAQALVIGLLDGVLEDVEKITGKHVELPNDTFGQNAIKEELFKQLYGYYPDYFLARVVRKFKGR